jgi:hypothetical protein
MELLIDGILNDGDVNPIILENFVYLIISSSKHTIRVLISLFDLVFPCVCLIVR